jgi:hypothetical protein
VDCESEIKDLHLMDLRHPSCHEAGHTVVGLYFGFRIDGIDVFEGRFRTLCDLDSVDRSDNERFVFLAGGIAGEQSGLGRYDFGGRNDDQTKISERGGGPIEAYLPEAIKIVESNGECLRQLRSRVTTRTMEKIMERQLSGGGNSFKLLTGEEIQSIWTACSTK